MKKLFLCTALLALAACSDASNTVRVLSDNGMTDIETTGYAFFACGENDAFSTGFRATSAQGKQVAGAVCSGWMKGYTIRYY